MQAQARRGCHMQAQARRNVYKELWCRHDFIGAGVRFISQVAAFHYLIALYFEFIKFLYQQFPQLLVIVGTVHYYVLYALN